MLQKKFKNKKLAILGFGIEGQETFKYLLKHGFMPAIIDNKSRETIVAENPDLQLAEIEILSGENYLNFVQNFDVVFKTPGIKNTAEILDAQEKGIVVTSQIELFMELCPCPTIGVTGTKGKGTTSTLIYEMLQESQKDVYLGGNIGIPALSFLDKLSPESVVVLELSSFQLQNLKQSPNIAVVLNITQEHLDYHADVAEYREAKKSIVKYQSITDKAIFNADYELPVAFATETKAVKYFVSKEKATNGCYVDRDDNIILVPTKEILTSVDKLLLRGRHNLENVTAASLAAYLAGAEVKSIRLVLESFKGLEHRLELVRDVSGIRYYNDSFSTVPETAIAAINAFIEPKILILGGSYKGSDYTELGRVIKRADVRGVILIGAMADEIEKAIGPNYDGQIVRGVETMSEMVEAAAKIAKTGDVVLLSPACASFGLFKNYKDRGNQFKKVVRQL